MSFQQLSLFRGMSSPWVGRACLAAALVFAGCNGVIFQQGLLHLILGVPCLLYWARTESKYRFFYLGGLAIFLCGMPGQIKTWLQHPGAVANSIGIGLISLTLWMLSIRLILGLLSEIRNLQDNIKQHVRNAHSLKLIEQKSALERQEESQQSNKASIEWDVLVRNARDGGANSVLACDVLEKTATLLTENNEQVKEMVEAAHSVARDTDQLTEISENIRAISTQARFLSLNIAVQAARIGESGKAFSLVAVQMKEMTDSTEKLTRTIDQRLTDIKGQTTKSTQLSAKVGRVFKSIKEELEQFRKLMLRIQELSTSQSKKLTAIKEGMRGRSNNLTQNQDRSIRKAS